MKLASVEEIVLLAAGRRVVLANGCFDILHVGHVRYLEAARQLGDILVVAINDDTSVRLLKGKGRPIMNLEERCRLVSALECVDYVVSFSEPDVGRVIEILKPAVQGKGHRLHRRHRTRGRSGSSLRGRGPDRGRSQGPFDTGHSFPHSGTL